MPGTPLRCPAAVDLVEVARAVAVPDAGPLPYQRVLAAAGDPAEEVRADRRSAAGQAPLCRGVGQAAGERFIGPFVGVGYGGGGAGAEDLGPDVWRRIHTSLI